MRFIVLTIMVLSMGLFGIACGEPADETTPADSTVVVEVPVEVPVVDSVIVEVVPEVIVTDSTVVVEVVVDGATEVVAPAEEVPAPVTQ